MIELRPYQRDALEALHRDWSTGLLRLGISAATGTGKTIIMSHLAHQFAQRNQRVLILVHRDELVRQTVDKLVRIDNSVSVGVVQAARNTAGARIVVASVQTACRPKRLAQLGRFGLIICDEAHRSVSNQWLDVLNGLGAMNPYAGVRTAGFSATWSRADNRALDLVWEKISFELSTEWAIEQGFLVQPRGYYIRTDIRLGDTKVTAGDYNAADLGKKLSRESVREAIVAGYREHADDRSGVVFAPTVDTGEFFRAGFEAAGYPTEGLYGVTSREESRLIHKRHASGETQIVISCTKLSEGWDAPHCSAAVIARPTVHAGLFVQQIGRVLRTHPGKQDAVILDPTGVLFKHKLNGVIDLSASEMIDADPDDEDEELEEPGTQEPAARVDAHVTGYQLVDLLEHGHLTTDGGIRFTHVSTERVRFVIEPGHRAGLQGHGPATGTPWYSVGEVSTTPGAPAFGWVARQLDRQAAMAMLPPKESVPGGTVRSRKTNAKQRNEAAQLGVYAKRGELAGSLFDRVQARLASLLLDGVQSWT